jgi:hypothetical protein
MRRLNLALAAVVLGVAAFWATGNPAPAVTFKCPSNPVTTCTSCLYFGVKSSYQCTLFCINGVPHRSCNTCGEGCNN